MERTASRLYLGSRNWSQGRFALRHAFRSRPFPSGDAGGSQSQRAERFKIRPLLFVTGFLAYLNRFRRVSIGVVPYLKSIALVPTAKLYACPTVLFARAAVKGEANKGEARSIEIARSHPGTPRRQRNANRFQRRLEDAP